ncbi:MAG: DUF4012 domain-containing protein [Dehalococcoidia bacterium]
MARHGTRWIWLACGAVLAIALLSSAAALRYYPAYRQVVEAKEELQSAEALLRDRGLDASAGDLARAEARLTRARDGFRSASGFLQEDPLLRVAKWLPVLGDQTTGARELARVGVDGADIGLEGVQAARAYREVRNEGSGTLTEKALVVLERTQPHMTAVRDLLTGMVERRRHLDGLSLLTPLTSAAQELDQDIEELADLVETYEETAAFVPDFLGFHGPRTYLVLAQNNAELLPTGGLISVYGVITLRDGCIEEMEFHDAIDFGQQWQARTSDYVEPPAPLKTYLLKYWSWNLSVSNWSPHFPTAAYHAQAFFQRGGGHPVDGVIAINVTTLEELLRVTGPVRIEEYGVTVTAENALDVTEELTRTALEPGTDRKAFVAFLADELVRRLMEAQPSQWSSLVEAVQRLRDEKNLLYYSNDRQVQEMVERMELDGGLRPSPGDYLMLVEASVNSTKLNIAIDQEVRMYVQLDALGNAHSQLEVSYVNNVARWERGRDPLLVKRLMLDGMYGGYLRLLAPAGSRLLGVWDGQTEVGAEEVSREQDKQVFGRFFALPRETSKRLTFRYLSPGVVLANGSLHEYRLLIQKQPGAAAHPFTLSIALPKGAELIRAELDGEELRALEDIETDLRQNRELVVYYRLES